MSKLTVLVVCMVLFSSGFIGQVSAQETGNNPMEIIESTNPSEASQEQIKTVEEWFYSEGDSLSEQQSDRVGQWIQTAQNSDTSGNTVDTPESVVSDINDTLTLREYDFNRDEGVVTLVLHSSSRTEQVVLTDPESAEDTGTGRVTQKAVTVPREETVEVEFEIEFTSYTNSATVWISSGAGETIYVSNSAETLVNRLEWAMIPASGLAGALAVFVSGLIYVFREYRSMNNEYTNVFNEI